MRQSFSFSIVFHILALAFLLVAARNQQMLSAESWLVQLTQDQTVSVAKTTAEHVQSPVEPDTGGVSDAMPQETPAEERVTEPEQPQPVPEAPTPEIPPLLRRPEPDMNLAIMQHRSSMLHAKMFILTAGSAVSGMLEKVLQEKPLTGLNGANAKVMLRYGTDGLLADAAVSADSDELKSLLDPLNWGDFPLPLSYSLRLSGLDIEIAIAGSVPKISFVTYF